MTRALEQHLGDEALAALHARPDDLHAGQQAVVEDLACRGAAGQQRLGHRQGGGLVAFDDGVLDLLVQCV